MSLNVHWTEHCKITTHSHGRPSQSHFQSYRKLTGTAQQPQIHTFLSLAVIRHISGNLEFQKRKVFCQSVFSQQLNTGSFCVAIDVNLAYGINSDLKIHLTTNIRCTINQLLWFLIRTELRATERRNCLKVSSFSYVFTLITFM